MLSIRKIGILGRTYRHLNRYRQILTVFFKYGFGDLVELLKIDQYIEIGLRMISRKRRERLEKLSRVERIRLAIEELGPTFIKLGQILSTRPDLISVKLIQELTKLQDEVPPFPAEDAKKIIESELGLPVNEVFDFFEDAPIASASIGQVHKAGLKDGEEVAVKVQRPGIRKVVEIDLEIMLHIATLMERHIEELALHRPVKIVEEFARTIEKEMDYTIEASNMERFCLQFINDPTVYIPKAFSSTTTERVLTMEFIDGIKISEISQLEATGINRKTVTGRGADLILKQIFEFGFFHADPHPGNIYVLPNNVICLLDFGMVGFVSKTMRNDFVDFVDSVVRRDESAATQVLLKLVAHDDDLDIRMLEREIADFMGVHLYKPLKDIKIGKLLQHLLILVSRFSLKIPSDFFLMMKALSTIEGVGLMLDPDFDMTARAKPFAKRIKIARFAPKKVADNIIDFLTELFQFIQRFPKDMLDITHLIKQKKIGIQLEHKGMETMLATFDQISNRISFSIIIASLIIGSAIIVISKIPPLIFGISMIGIIPFITAVIMGLWLLVAIIKKGRL